MNKLVNCGLENRFGTNCLKWDGLKSRFGNENLIAMWVADMDFKAPQPVIDALKERVNHGIFGYNIKKNMDIMLKKNGLDFHQG